jgi:Fe-S cluster assembly protein SufB
MSEEILEQVKIEQSPPLSENELFEEMAQQEYKYGFETHIDMDIAPKGLDEDVIRMISKKKNEPQFMLEWRLKAFEHWKTMNFPGWAKLNVAPIDFQDIIYYAAPKKKKQLASMDEVDEELVETFNKLGISLMEQKMLAGVAVDAVFDSVSVATTFKGKLAKEGIIFCSINEAIQEYPDLIKKYLGTVVPYTDNFFSKEGDRPVGEIIVKTHCSRSKVLWDSRNPAGSSHDDVARLNTPTDR